MNWQDRPASRWALRQSGIVLLLAAYAAGWCLPALVADNAGDPPPLAYLLALVGFLGFSAGCALLLYGHHLFDRVEIAGRWQHRTSARQRRRGADHRGDDDRGVAQEG